MEIPIKNSKRGKICMPSPNPGYNKSEEREVVIKKYRLTINRIPKPVKYFELRFIQNTPIGGNSRRMSVNDVIVLMS